MNNLRANFTPTMRSITGLWLALTAIALACGTARAQTAFGPANPFYAASSLPFQAPPFDRIKDSDYQPAIDAGLAQLLNEANAIAGNPAQPTFDNTLVALEKSGQLLNRVMFVFNCVTSANTDDDLQKVQHYEAPRLAANYDAIFLNSRLFVRVKAVYDQRASLHLDPESLKLADWYYQQFVHAGANLSDSDKEKLKKLNEEDSTLSNQFMTRLLAGTKDAAYSTTNAAMLAGLSPAQLDGAARTAQDRKQQGWVVSLQNTTEQPDLAALTNRDTRRALFENSWNRTERGDANDTRSTIARLAQLRAQKAALLGYPSYAAWTLTDQMAKTPQAALHFVDALVPATRAKAASEASDIQALIDSQHGGFKLEPWD